MKETKIPVIQSCNFAGYDASSLMSETARLRKIITKRGTLEILIPLCCSTEPVRHKQFRQALKGISSKTLASRLKELEKGGSSKERRTARSRPGWNTGLRARDRNS